MIHEMLFFVRNIESYIMYDVLEVAWRRFQYHLAKSKSLDNIIWVHRMFVEEISVKCFRERMGESEAMVVLREKLDRCLHIILRACSIIGDIQTKVRSYEFKEPEVSSLPANSSSLDGIVNSYKNNSARADARAVMSNEASNGIMHLNNIKMEFRNVLQVILENMYTMSHSKLLTFQLNFNGFYDDLGFKEHRVTHESVQCQSSESTNQRSMYDQKIAETSSLPFVGEEKMSETFSRETTDAQGFSSGYDEDKTPTRVKKRKQECVSNSGGEFWITSSTSQGERLRAAVGTASNLNDPDDKINHRLQDEKRNSILKLDVINDTIRSSKFNSTKTSMYFSKHSDLLNRITDLALKRRKRQGELDFRSGTEALTKKRKRSM